MRAFFRRVLGMGDNIEDAIDCPTREILKDPEVETLQRRAQEAEMRAAELQSRVDAYVRDRRRRQRGRYG